MADNRGAAYMGTGKVEIQDIDFPTFGLQDGPGVNPANIGRKLPHAAILRCVATNICGSDRRILAVSATVARRGVLWACRSRGVCGVKRCRLRAPPHGLRFERWWPASPTSRFPINRRNTNQKNPKNSSAPRNQVSSHPGWSDDPRVTGHDGSTGPEGGEVS
jgi:hypothetical protein